MDDLDYLQNMLGMSDKKPTISFKKQLYERMKDVKKRALEEETKNKYIAYLADDYNRILKSLRDIIYEEK